MSEAFRSFECGRVGRVALAGGFALGAVCGLAPGQITVFDDADAFILATGAVAEPPIPDLGLVGRTGAVWTLGRLTYSVSTTDPMVALIFDEFNPIHPGNEVALSSVEDVEVRVDTPVYGFGHYFVEGTDTPLSCSSTCPCRDATFEVTLLLGISVVGSFTFNTPDDVLAFVGVSSTEAFDTVRFRDLSRACDNEYWGRFFLADAPPYCPADFNMDGGIDGADVEAFFVAWEAGDSSADVNVDGGVDGADVEAFFAAWETGGCG